MLMQEWLKQVANQTGGLEREDESSVSAVFPGNLGWFVRTPDPQLFLVSNGFRLKVCITVTVLEVLAVGIGSTLSDHLKVDVPVTDVDLSHSPPVSVLHLGFQGYRLPLDQSFQGLGGPLAACPLGRFWGIDTSQADRDLLPFRTGHSHRVAVTHGYQGDRTREQTRLGFSGRSTAAVAVPLTCLAVGVATP